jgi:glyoxylase-like metal-dependent hydrolase (beta-lactamase superfamily II)
MTHRETFKFRVPVASYASVGLSLTLMFASQTAGAPAVRHIQIAPPAARSNVPDATAQGLSLSPQAVSAVDISADGKVLTIGTMAFSHDANVWQFAPDGTVLAQRHFPPWAPMQVATLSGGKAMAVGLAYSRVTSPDPTVWLGRAEELMIANRTDDLAESDPRDGQLARLRTGAGEWRLGWFASSLGELFVRGPDWIFKPPSLFLDDSGQRQRLRYEDKNLLPTGRALRMAASRDGKRVAFGWIGFSRNIPDLPTRADALSVWQVNPNQRLWSSSSAITNTPQPLPDPVKDFGEMGKEFRLAADAFVPGHATAALAMNADGSRVAALEYGVWGWVRSRPAIGKWDPPIHVLNFLPRQRGHLRVFNSAGHELDREQLLPEGMFEIALGSSSNEVWCWPAAWFARGMAGAVWLPTDSPARTLYRIGLEENSTVAFDFPDAVADVAVSPAREQVLVSCWDGRLYVLDASSTVTAKHDIGGPARLAWSSDGSFAVAGTVAGNLLRFEQSGALGWRKTIPVTEVPASSRPPAEVVTGLPIFQGGRIHQGEHAYVGDIWIIKNGGMAVLVDAGGLSGTSITRARLRALGIEQVTHVLQTHSHGDHAGGAYLWRAAGAKIVGPKSAALPLTWLMPMLTDYGIYPPRPLDVALPLTSTGDETDFEAGGLKVGALFVPGHSFDLTIYKIELAGKRVALTGDLGFENQDILHRCWGDADKARDVVKVIRDKLLPWRPDIVFTGHGVRTNGTEFITALVRSTEESLKKESKVP